MKPLTDARHPIDLIARFTTITPELEAGLRQVMREHFFQKGDVVKGWNNLGSYAYFLTSGSARLFYTTGGKEHTVSFAFQGEFVLIPHTCLDKHSDTLAIEFLAPTHAVFIPHLQVKSMLEESRPAADFEGLLFLNAALFQYCTFLEERVDVMQSKSAEERYRWVLRRYPMLEECATTTQIASFLGVTKETLYRIKNGKYVSSPGGTVRRGSNPKSGSK